MITNQVKNRSFISFVCIFAFIMLVSCNSEAKKSYENLHQEISLVDFDSFDPVVVDLIIKKIDAHLKAYPDFEQNQTLLNFKEKVSDFKNEASVRMEDMDYQKILSQINDPNDVSLQDYESAISSLNNAKEMLSSYLQNAKITNNIEDATKRIEGINERIEHINVEFRNNLQVLMERMKNEAKTQAEKAHSTYRVETCFESSNSPEVTGYSSNVEKTYQVSMSGKILGMDKRTLTISVSGRIKGGPRTGVSIDITGSKIDSDIKK